MVRKIYHLYVVLCLLLACPMTGYGTHLMGGSLNYEYLGLDTVSGNYNYRITITIYRLCDPGSSLLPVDMNLGVYEDDPAMPAGDKLLVLNTIVPIVSQQNIVPPNANDTCTFAPNVCVEQGIYETIVSVPTNTTGYYFISDRCCRNNNIMNLANPGAAGQVYFAKAPAPTVVNNSPTFAVAPVPFICNTDTVSILNQAFDPDGDLLVYNLVTPYNGVSGPGNPNPNPPAVYPWSIPTVNYAPTFSVTQPFGPGGYATINSSTGLSQYYSPNQGFFVLAVEISEYRNGQLIGSMRRDLQIIVISCPPNPAPNLAPTTPQTSYTIHEGDSLCFSTTFTDANGDSLFITHLGDIFDPGITNPAATFIDSTGAGTATGLFCWYTSCDQGSAIPYQFTVVATDNGCPAKVTNIVYTITVLNTPDPGPINGPDTLCANTAMGIQYHVPLDSGYTHHWFVNNASISGPSTGDTILVDFSGSGTATISVYTENVNGCFSDTIIKNVVLNALPAASAGSDVMYCSGDNASIGSAAVPGQTYQWTPATGLSSDTVANPIVSATNSGVAPVTNVYVVTVTQDGCSNTDTVEVTINPRPAPAGGPDVSICSGDSAMLGQATVPGQTYVWSPSAGLSDTTIADPVVTGLDTTGTADTLLYVVTAQNVYGCITTDTVQVIVHPVPVAAAGPAQVFCSGDSAVLGGSAVPGYTYSWSPATGLSSTSDSDPTLVLSNTSGQNDTLYYMVTATLGPCVDTDSVMVVVKPNPVANAGSAQLICAGGTIQLGTAATPGYTYAWSPSTGLSDTTLSDPVLTLNNTGPLPDTLFYVVMTTLNGCTSFDTVQVISSPVPLAVAGMDTVYCSGYPVVIGATAQPNYSYSWSPPAGLSSDTISDPVVTHVNTSGVNDTLLFVLTTGLFGCFDSDTIQVVVKPSPVPDAGQDTTLCGGDSLVIGTGPTPGYTYTWSPGAGLSGTSISNPTVTVSNMGGGPVTLTYAVVTDLNGCAETDSITITVNPQPVVAAAASPAVICDGDTTVLSASGATGYSWALASAPGTPVSTDSTLAVSPSSTTTYILTGAYATGCENTDSITITVNLLPAVQISANDTICDGDTLLLTANGASTYSWSVSGGGIIGSGPTIQVNPSSNTTYIVSGTDSNMCVNTDSISVTVNPAATLTSVFGNASVCPGVMGVTYWVGNPNPNSTYTWTVTNGTVVTGQGTDTITVDWSVNPGTGQVSVVEITDLGCMSDPVLLNVIINVMLTPVAPTGPTTLCANEAQGIIYSILGTPGSTYNWFAQGGNVTGGNGTATVTIDWTVAGPQTVLLWYEETSMTITDTCFGTSDTLAITINPIPVTGAISGPAGICVSDTGSFSVVNTSSSSYAWFISGGTVTSGDGTNAITAAWTGSGTATVMVVETNMYGCVGDTVMYQVIVYALPAANAGMDTDVCIGQGVQLNASGGVTYQWSPANGLSGVNIEDPVASPVVTTTYTVLVTDSNGCMNTDSVVVTVNPLPVISLTPDSDVCIGSSIQLNASGGTSYLWSPAGSLTNANIADPVATPMVTTTYTVIVTDGNGCIDSATVTITVNPLPTVTVSPDTIICDGSSTTLSAGGGVSYSWIPAGSLNNPNSANPVATPSVPTTYTVTVTDANGCSDQGQVFVDLNPQPEASFLVDDGGLAAASCLGYDANLINTSSEALNYLWIFEDGSTATITDPVVHFNLTGSNIITLIAYNNFCSDTAVVDHTSTAVAQVFDMIPDVITPNGDGLNDCFKLGMDIDLEECSEWMVFNRWGNRVFTGSPSQPCWNGRQDNNGSEMPAGTYFIVIAIEDEQYKGTITLIR